MYQNRTKYKVPCTKIVPSTTFIIIYKIVPNTITVPSTTILPITKIITTKYQSSTYYQNVPSAKIVPSTKLRAIWAKQPSPPQPKGPEILFGTIL